MNVSSTMDFGRLLAPVGRALGRHADVAQSLLEVRADAELQSRLDDLASRNTEGELTPAERAEYEHWVQAANLVAYLQAEARLALSAVPRS